MLGGIIWNPEWVCAVDMSTAKWRIQMPQIHGLANSSQGQPPRHDKPSSDPHTNASKWSLAKTSVCRNYQSTGCLQADIAPHRGCLWRLAHPPPPFSAVCNKPTSFIQMHKINSEFAACYWYVASIRVPEYLDPSFPVGLIFFPSSLQSGQPKTVQVKAAVEQHRGSRSRSHRGFPAPAFLQLLSAAFKQRFSDRLLCPDIYFVIYFVSLFKFNQRTSCQKEKTWDFFWKWPHITLSKWPISLWDPVPK